MVIITMAICFTNILVAQTSDTVRSGNGTTIINFGAPATGNSPRRVTQPVRRPQPVAPVAQPTYIPDQRPVYKLNDNFLSNDGVTWWLIILSILGFGVIIALLFLVARRSSCACYSNNCHCYGYNSNGSMSHTGNVNHTGNVKHAGDVNVSGKVDHLVTVEHRHTLGVVFESSEEKTTDEIIEKKD